jgi:hypothetical protein
VTLRLLPEARQEIDGASAYYEIEHNGLDRAGMG